MIRQALLTVTLAASSLFSSCEGDKPGKPEEPVTPGVVRSCDIFEDGDHIGKTESKVCIIVQDSDSKERTVTLSTGSKCAAEKRWPDCTDE